MNLWFRLLALLLLTPFRPKLPPPLGVSRLKFRVLPNDLDSNLHMTNSRYWTVFDLGRTDLLLRMGLLGVVMKRKWAPMVGAGAIRFRRELKLFQPYVLETRVSAWSGSRLVMEQRVLIGKDEAVAARGLILAGFYDRKARGFVACERIFEATGATDVAVPALDAAATAMLKIDQALRE